MNNTNTQLYHLQACPNQDRVRFKKKELCNIRNDFMRDRDRITHSEAFRKLKDKAQVFIILEHDSIRTRLSHTLEVTQIARTVARALSLNEDLTEAIGLGHDLGHAPFGHIGERALSEIAQEWFPNSVALKEINYFTVEGEKNWFDTPSKEFRHNVHSLKIVDFWEKQGKGLNLTYEVRDGILKHSKWGQPLFQADKKFLPITLEGQIVRIVDRIAYVNHDLEDALTSRIITKQDIPANILSSLGSSQSERIGTCVNDLISTTKNSSSDIKMSTEVHQSIDSLYQFLLNKVYQNPVLKVQEKQARFMIKSLAHYYREHKQGEWFLEEKVKNIKYSSSVSIESKIIDYIASLTDHSLKTEFKECFVPKGWQ